MTTATTTVDATDYVHTGPDALCGKYLRTFWHPVYRSQDVAPGRAVPLEVMDERVTLYRGEEGDPHIVAFRCAHRGTQLSSGWVEGNSIRCRYHGWKYDSSGQCVEQPGESESFAAKVKIRSYPVQDYLGLVFAYLGEGEPPPLPHFPDFDASEGVVSPGLPEDWPCNYFSRMDNDPAHPPYTHRESVIRAGGSPRAIGAIIAEETDYGVRVGVDRGRFYNQKIWPICTMICSEDRAARMLGIPGDDRSIRQDRLLYYLPVNDERMMCYTVDFVYVTGDDAEAYRKRRQVELDLGFAPLEEMAEEILAGKMTLEGMDTSLSTYQTFRIEDYVTIVGQGRIAPREMEHLGRVDAQNILIRKIFNREMKALAEGQPLKEWALPAGASGMLLPESLMLGGRL